MEVPDQKGRLSILKVHAKNKKLSEEVELASVAMRTPGFSGADLANLLNEVSVSFVLTLTALYIIVQRCHIRMMSSHSIVHMTRSKFAPATVQDNHFGILPFHSMMSRSGARLYATLKAFLFF